MLLLSRDKRSGLLTLGDAKLECSCEKLLNLRPAMPSTNTNCDMRNSDNCGGIVPE